MARSAVLLGRHLADLVRNVLIIGSDDRGGLSGGFHFHAGVLNALASVAVRGSFGFALSWIFASWRSLCAREAPSPRASWWSSARLRGSVVRPVSTMPDWLQTFAKRARSRLRPTSRARMPSRGHTELFGRDGHLDRRPSGGVHPALRMAVPADELVARGPRGKIARALASCRLSADESRPLAVDELVLSGGMPSPRITPLRRRGASAAGLIAGPYGLPRRAFPIDSRSAPSSGHCARPRDRAAV